MVNPITAPALKIGGLVLRFTSCCPSEKITSGKQVSAAHGISKIDPMDVAFTQLSRWAYGRQQHAHWS
jgi:hypothetical protein